MKSTLIAAIVCSVLATGASAAKLPDPRVCELGQAAPCARANAFLVLKRGMAAKSHAGSWDSDIQCVPKAAGLLRYRCGWGRPGSFQYGAAVVVWDARTFRATLTLISNVCQFPPGVADGPVRPGCTAMVTVAS